MKSTAQRRLFLTAAVAALTALPAAAHACPLERVDHRATGDRLTITVAHTDSGADGTYELRCGSEGSTHPSPRDACERLDQLAANGEDPFAPVPAGTMCTQVHGGDATAHVTGTWQGRHVDGSFKRTDGCEISRWNAMGKVLSFGGA
ncbi:SSI family serine proteinase inhibitor [Streptomyces sp. NPDC059063]|uniref:SSI family serine proteinase inhibitor n=1 Tax=unclassified Streptomyces TaxID=2593676 RepID=UPI0036AE058C